MLHIHTGFLGLLASCVIAFSTLSATPAHADERYILDITSPQPFPNVKLLDPYGKPATLSELSGKLTIVHFWATWCNPCVEELPELDEIQKRYEVVGLKVLAISLDGSRNKDKVAAFLKANKVTGLKLYFDNSTDAFKASKAKGMPTSFFINNNGDRIALSEGKLDWLNPKTTGFLEFNLYKK